MRFESDPAKMIQDNGTYKLACHYKSHQRRGSQFTAEKHRGKPIQQAEETAQPTPPPGLRNLLRAGYRDPRCKRVKENAGRTQEIVHYDGWHRLPKRFLELCIAACLDRDKRTGDECKEKCESSHESLSGLELQIGRLNILGMTANASCADEPACLGVLNAVSRESEVPMSSGMPGLAACVVLIKLQGPA